ncbi:MAG: aminotransferase class V-fold PLP-dependent enzyme, partial [Candidatus Tectomicrobia bacterium]|nr:aminotransferase class V-fold PLP-dependent enzyme [Candidatus Tectomicrobia bacterium]
MTRDLVYFNHASVASPSLRVQEAVQGFLRDFLRRGDQASQAWHEYAEVEAKARFARLIGAEREEIAFLKNTTEGIATVANGLDWS